MLCEGINVDEPAAERFGRQNPSNVKRGGLSSGGKMRLGPSFFVNAPIYYQRQTDIQVVSRGMDGPVRLMLDGKAVAQGEILPAPDWYGQQVDGFAITQILTAHNRQLAGSVYEDCVLFGLGKQCEFCVINQSVASKAPQLVNKSGRLILSAIGQIPTDEYAGLTLNGGMTLAPGRGMEKLVPVVSEISRRYPNLPIGIEMTPPADLEWIDRIVDAGASAVMMNLETWDAGRRAKAIPGKDQYCPRGSYLAAFERAVKRLGAGRVSTCFVVGTEPIESLLEGIRTVIGLGVVPSPLAGRYFEDISNYPFAPNVKWPEFLQVVQYAYEEARMAGLRALDKAGCVACGMCDIIKDVVE